jgi:peroxiredoxin
MIDKIKVGDESIDLHCKARMGKTFKLSEFLGKRVLLSFIPWLGPKSVQNR